MALAADDRRGAVAPLAGPADERSPAPAVTRAAAVLDALAAEPGRSVGLAELARLLGLPKSSLANICASLGDAGLVRRTADGYRLGAKLAELGAAYLGGIDLVREFHDTCAALASAVPALDETAQLAVLGDGLDVVYLARRDGRQPVRLSSAPGQRLPASCTATGKAMLAALDPAERRRRLGSAGPLPRLTRASIGSVRALRRELEAVADAGVAFDRGEVVEGVVCVARALRTGAGPSEVAAVSFTLLEARATDDRVAELTAGLERVTAELAARLGVVAGAAGDTSA